MGVLLMDIGTAGSPNYVEIGPGSIADHGGLAGLGDDDHTQYLRTDGTRALTAAWDAGSFQIRAETFRSDVAAGTPPLVVASNTLVSNLNADTVDGVQEAAFLLIAGTRAMTGNLNMGSNPIIACSGITLTGDITTTGTAIDWDLLDNDAAALTLDTAGVGPMMSFDTRTGVEEVLLGVNLDMGANDILNIGTSMTSTANDVTWNVQDSSTTALIIKPVTGATILTIDTSSGAESIRVGADINTVAGSIDWDLIDNTSLALSWDSTGTAGIMSIHTTNSAEKVRFGVNAEVAGNLFGGTTTSDDLDLDAHDQAWAIGNTGRINMGERIEWGPETWTAGAADTVFLMRDTRTYVSFDSMIGFTVGGPVGFYFHPTLDYADRIIATTAPAFWAQGIWQPDHTSADIAANEGFRGEPSILPQNSSGTCTTADLTGYFAAPVVSQIGAGSATHPEMFGFKFGNAPNAAAGAAQNVVGANTTVTLLGGLLIQNPSVSGSPTITTLVGVDINSLTRGGTNLSIRSTGGEMRHVGAIVAGANAAATNASVGLEVQSTTKAFLSPRMTTTQRDALTAVNGMIIYNSTTAQMEGRIAGAWAAM